MIDRALSQYAGGAKSPVVRDRARIIAARALKDYDPGKAKVETHLMNRLRELQREVPKFTDPLPMPERFRVDQWRINQARSEIEEEQGREALPEEIADRTNIPLKRVKRVSRRMVSRVPWSAYEQTDDDDDSDIDIAVSERTPWDEWVDAVYNDLPTRDRLIMRYRSGYDGSPTLSNDEIAEKLGISPQVVSQRSRLIQKKLDSFR